MIIEIQIELLVLFLIVFLLVGWAFWHRYSLKKAKIKYKPEEDLSRNGESYRKRFEGRESTPSETTVSVPRITGDAIRKQFQDGSVVSSGEVVDSSRKNRKSFRGIIGKLRRNK